MLVQIAEADTRARRSARESALSGLPRAKKPSTRTSRTVP